MQITKHLCCETYAEKILNAVALDLLSSLHFDGLYYVPRTHALSGMQQHQLIELVHDLWDCDFGEPFPRPFHYALSYAGVFKALGLPIKLDEGEAWEKLWENYECGGDETSDGEQYLFRVMNEIDYLSIDQTDDEPRCTREEILHALTERFYAETLISLDLKADDGLNVINQNAKRRSLGEMD